MILLGIKSKDQFARKRKQDTTLLHIHIDFLLNNPVGRGNQSCDLTNPLQLKNYCPFPFIFKPRTLGIVLEDNELSFLPTVTWCILCQSSTFESLGADNTESLCCSVFAGLIHFWCLFVPLEHQRAWHHCHLPCAVSGNEAEETFTASVHISKALTKMWYKIGSDWMWDSRDANFLGLETNHYSLF